MSKIQFNQLNTPELEVLSAEATAEVVGGYSSFYSRYVSRFSSKVAGIQQVNFNQNNQVALGGGAFSNTSNFNSTNQSNNANINQ